MNPILKFQRSFTNKKLFLSLRNFLFIFNFWVRSNLVLGCNHCIPLVYPNSLRQMMEGNRIPKSVHVSVVQCTELDNLRHFYNCNYTTWSSFLNYKSRSMDTNLLKLEYRVSWELSDLEMNQDKNIPKRCNGLMRLYNYLHTSHNTFGSFPLSLAYYSQVVQPHTMIPYFHTMIP